MARYKHYEKLCKVEGCGKYMFNKLPSSKYCKPCGEVIDEIRTRINNVRYKAQEKFLNYKFKIIVKVKRKCQ